MGFTITPEALNESARKFKKELLIMAVLGLGETLKHMTLRTGIKYEEVVGELSGIAELEPYKGTIPADEDDIDIAGRTLKTYLGQCVKLIDPNTIISSLYGNAVTNGKALKDADIAKAVVALIMSRQSQALNKGLFSAVRNAGGTTTADLFDGFDTITAAEIAANKIDVANGNYMVIDGKIDNTNAVDHLKSIYFGSSDELQMEKTKLFLPFAKYNAYNEDYKATTGSIAYNTEYKKTFLEGSGNKCELVPLIGKAGSDLYHLTTKRNTLIGTYLQGDLEKIEVRRGDNPFKLQFINTMFFGTQFETLSKEALFVMKNTNPTV